MVIYVSFIFVIRHVHNLSKLFITVRFISGKVYLNKLKVVCLSVIYLVISTLTTHRHFVGNLFKSTTTSGDQLSED